MRIDLQELSTTRLALDLPTDRGEDQRIVVRDLKDLRGVLVSTDEHLTLSGVRAKSLALEEFAVVTEAVSMNTGSPARFDGVTVELGFERAAPASNQQEKGMEPVSGRIELDALAPTRASISPGDVRVSGTVSAHELSAIFDEKSLRASVGKLLVNEMQTAIQGLLLRVGEIVLSGVSAHTNERVSSTRIAANAPEAEGRDMDVTVADVEISRVSLGGNDVEVALDRMNVEGGVKVETLSKQVRVHLPGLTFSTIEVSLPEPLSLLGGERSSHVDPIADEAAREGLPKADALGVDFAAAVDGERAVRDPSESAELDGAAGEGKPAKRAEDRDEEDNFVAMGPGADLPVDLTQLDRLTGKFEADVVVEAQVPVIGTRKGTHEFRVPIADGLINFKQLEHGLSTLEDMMLDISHRNEYLVFERDLPVIHKRKALVRWPLPTQQDRALAEQDSVRLRHLLTPEIPHEEEDQSEPAVQLERIAVKKLRLELTAVRSGDEVPPSADGITDIECGSLRLEGSLTFEPEADEPPPGELTLTVDMLSLGLSGLPLGGAQVESGRVRIEGIPGLKVRFAGITPVAITGSIRGLRLENVVIALPESGTESLDPHPNS